MALNDNEEGGKGKGGLRNLKWEGREGGGRPPQGGGEERERGFDA